MYVDFEFAKILEYVKQNGVPRETRSGQVISTFSAPEFRYDMRYGAPILSGKKIALKAMVGELLWFLDGAHSLHQLREKTFGKDAGQNTIWTADQIRWKAGLDADIVSKLKYQDDLGRIYGRQWRNSAGKFGVEVDQIKKLIEGLKKDPFSRYHIVNAWNAAEVAHNMMALPPCHVLFQCYVGPDNTLSLKWYQRSVDCFLGLPFNIASYGLLLSILCKLTGYKEGELIGSFGDTHIYSAHLSAVEEYLNNPFFEEPKLVLPEFNTLEEVCAMTALDFEDAYQNYQHSGVIKAPLSVG